MESILCLTDYAGNSAQTFRFALQIAHSLHVRLFLVHVLDTPGDILEEKDLPQNPLAGRYSEAFTRLKEFAAANGGEKLAGAMVRYIIAGGSPRDRALELIKDHDIDLVVMGMRNRNPFADRIFGTLAGKMIDQSPCPLLLIPPGVTFRPVRGLAYATDFNYDNLNAIELLLRWGEVFNAPLYLLHFSGALEAHARAEAIMERIVHTFDEEYKSRRIAFVIQEGEVAAGIKRFTTDTPVDIIAMTRHSRGMWARWTSSSLAKQLAETANIPVLIFKAKE
jgi:nucleotide-binding universal stress UspA family protein